jgi:hypothetical protein
MTSLEVQGLLAKTASLLKSGSWATGLREIVRGIATTCAATRARRRPPREASEITSEEDSEGSSADASARQILPASQASASRGTNPVGATSSGEWGLFSRILGGGAAAFLFLVALRQRKKNAERSAEQAAELARRPAGPKYLGPPRIDR